MDISTTANADSARIVASKQFGTADHNIGGGSFLSGTVNPATATVGAFADYNVHGHGLSLSKTYTPGFGSVTSESAKLNILNHSDHQVNAHAFASQTHLDNGFNLNKHGGGLDYSNSHGFGASAGVTNIPAFKTTTLDVGAHAPLWQSKDNAGSLNLNAGASQVISGPFRGPPSYSGGLGFNMKF